MTVISVTYSISVTKFAMNISEKGAS